jgi:enamine deaminase RidA (YjgF/YER057c/UK114 family)
LGSEYFAHVYPNVPGAGAALGVRTGDVFYAAGLEAPSGVTGLDGVREQTRAVLRELEALLAAQGGSLANLARVTGYVADAGEQREAVYDVWDVVFPRADDKPAFKILDAPLPPGVMFRLDVLALLGHTRKRIDIAGVDARDPTVRIGNWVLTSRLHGTSETGEIVPGLEAQARQALANGIRLVELAGGSKRDITQVCGFGRDQGYVETLQHAIDEAFAGEGRKPAFQPITTFVRPVLEVMVEVTAVINKN